MPAAADLPLPPPPLSSPSSPGLRQSDRATDRRDRSDRELAPVRALSWLLDRAYLDPILGFVLPGAGDVVGSVVGMYTIGVALRLGLPPIVIARMLMNLAADAALGLIPFVGDMADVAFRAHRKNLALLTDRGPSRRTRPADWLLVIGAFALLVSVLVLVVWGLIRLVGAVS
jgi:hypothetical protein